VLAGSGFDRFIIINHEKVGVTIHLGRKSGCSFIQIFAVEGELGGLELIINRLKLILILLHENNLVIIILSSNIYL
jgi:hypothetical protein